MARIQPKFFETRPDRNDLSLYKELVEEFNAQPGRYRTPYVLFGHIVTERNTTKDPAVQYTPAIHKLPVGESHGTEAGINRYVERGFVVLDYWLPPVGQVPPAISRGDVEIQSGWGLDWSAKRRADLEAVILRAKNQGDALYSIKQTVKGQSEEIGTLKQKLADAQAELARKEQAKEARSRG